MTSSLSAEHALTVVRVIGDLQNKQQDATDHSHNYVAVTADWLRVRIDQLQSMITVKPTTVKPKKKLDRVDAAPGAAAAAAVTKRVAFNWTYADTQRVREELAKEDVREMKAEQRSKHVTNIMAAEAVRRNEPAPARVVVDKVIVELNDASEKQAKAARAAYPVFGSIEKPTLTLDELESLFNMPGSDKFTQAKIQDALKVKMSDALKNRLVVALKKGSVGALVDTMREYEKHARKAKEEADNDDDANKSPFTLTEEDIVGATQLLDTLEYTDLTKYGKLTKVFTYLDKAANDRDEDAPTDAKVEKVISDYNVKKLAVRKIERLTYSNRIPTLEDVQFLRKNVHSSAVTPQGIQDVLKVKISDTLAKKMSDAIRGGKDVMGVINTFRMNKERAPAAAGDKPAITKKRKEAPSAAAAAASSSSDPKFLMCIYKHRDPTIKVKYMVVARYKVQFGDWLSLNKDLNVEIDGPYEDYNGQLYMEDFSYGFCVKMDDDEHGSAPIHLEQRISDGKREGQPSKKARNAAAAAANSDSDEEEEKQKKKPHKYTPEEDAKMLEMDDKKLGVQAIADELKLTRDSVRKHLLVLRKNQTLAREDAEMLEILFKYGYSKKARNKVKTDLRMSDVLAHDRLTALVERLKAAAKKHRVTSLQADHIDFGARRTKKSVSDIATELNMQEEEDAVRAHYNMAKYNKAEDERIKRDTKKKKNMSISRLFYYMDGHPTMQLRVAMKTTDDLNAWADDNNSKFWPVGGNEDDKHVAKSTELDTHEYAYSVDSLNKKTSRDFNLSEIGELVKVMQASQPPASSAAAAAASYPPRKSKAAAAAAAAEAPAAAAPTKPSVSKLLAASAARAIRKAKEKAEEDAQILRNEQKVVKFSKLHKKYVLYGFEFEPAYGYKQTDPIEVVMAVPTRDVIIQHDGDDTDDDEIEDFIHDNPTSFDEFGYEGFVDWEQGSKYTHVNRARARFIKETDEEVDPYFIPAGTTKRLPLEDVPTPLTAEEAEIAETIRSDFRKVKRKNPTASKRDLMQELMQSSTTEYDEDTAVSILKDAGYFDSSFVAGEESDEESEAESESESEEEDKPVSAYDKIEKLYTKITERYPGLSRKDIVDKMHNELEVLDHDEITRDLDALLGAEEVDDDMIQQKYKQLKLAHPSKSRDFFLKQLDDILKVGDFTVYEDALADIFAKEDKMDTTAGRAKLSSRKSMNWW